MTTNETTAQAKYEKRQERNDNKRASKDFLRTRKDGNKNTNNKRKDTLRAKRASKTQKQT